MRQFLRTLSDLLETRRATITHDELIALRGDVRDLMLELKMLVPTRPATHVVCNACHEDHVEEVVRIKTGKDVVFRMACPDSGWVDVPADRLRQWTLDVPRLVSLLAAGIGASDAAESVVPESVWQLGFVEIAGVVHSVVLVCGGIRSLGTAASKLLPQRTVVVRSEEAPGMIDGYGATLGLTSAFTFESGQFVFQVDEMRRVLVAESGTGGNVFRRRSSEVWQLSFGGETKFLTNSVGFGYIACLLSQPNKIISAVTLLAARAGIHPLVMAGSLGDVLDDETRMNFRKRYNDLQEDLEEARRNDDHGRQEKIEKEMEELMVQLAGAVDIRGRPRQQTDAEKVRKSVSEAVRRDMDRIAKEHPCLGNHLTASIFPGTDFRYAPGCDMDWLV